jgi:hypothetical protein
MTSIPTLFLVVLLALGQLSVQAMEMRGVATHIADPLEASSAATTVELALFLNEAVFLPGDVLDAELEVLNFAPAFTADFYFGAILPDGVTLVFFTNLSPLNGVTTRLDADPRTFQPLLANILVPEDLDIIINDFFSFTFQVGIPPGVYGIFALLTPLAAFADGRIDAGDLLALDIRPLRFSP